MAPAGNAGVAAAATAAVTADFTVAWRAALDDMELEVERVEAMLRSLHSQPVHYAPGAWTPPQIAQPLPESMRERAEVLLERQLAAVSRLSVAMTSSRKHQQVVGRLVDNEAVKARPMYVDQAM